jgi:RND family efflux transporter MFP subunit
VLQVAATDPLELRAFAAPELAARIRPGMRATLSADGSPEARAGEVVQVSPALDAQSGNALVRIRFSNPAEELRIGGVVRARVTTGEEQGVVTVPASALLPLGDGGLGVAIVEEGKVRGVPVVVRSEEEGQAVIQAELKGGERLIVEGGYSLPEGTEVEVVQ